VSTTANLVLVFIFVVVCSTQTASQRWIKTNFGLMLQQW